jgi:hypothetical protein
VWVCGSSPDSAVVAGELGVCYAYHDFIGRARGGASGENPIRVYRESFRPRGLLRRPRDNVTVYGACAATDAEARRVWDALTLPPADGAAPRWCFLGEPGRVRDQLLQLRERYATDELVVNCAGCCLEESIAGYALVAAAMGLGVERWQAGTATGGARRSTACPGPARTPIPTPPDQPGVMAS